MRRLWISILATAIFACAMASSALAEGNQLSLQAGSNYIHGSFYHQKYLATGYLKLGLSGTYADYDSKQYSLGTVSLAVGNDALAPGLTCELGLKGIGGKVEKYSTKSDVGNLAFTLAGGYMLPRKIVPLPLELRGNLEWAPEILSSLDSEGYFGYGLGLGFYLVDNAALILSFQHYKFDLDKPNSWDFEDDVVSIGIELHF